MAFLTREEFVVISDIDITNDTLLDIWLEVANGYLTTFCFNEALEGLQSALKIIAVAIVEHFYATSRRSAVLGANSAFRSEKFGSYSYQRFTQDSTNEKRDLIYSLSPGIQTIFGRYLCELDPRLITTSVFKELPENMDGIREWHQYNDYELSSV